MLQYKIFIFTNGLIFITEVEEKSKNNHTPNFNHLIPLNSQKSQPVSSINSSFLSGSGKGLPFLLPDHFSFITAASFLNTPMCHTLFQEQVFWRLFPFI